MRARYFKVENGLRLARFLNMKILAIQVRDHRALGVHHDHVEHHQARDRADRIRAVAVFNRLGWVGIL